MKIYKNVYFRINTPSYYKPNGVGFKTPEDSNKFHTETLNIFLNDNWTVKESKYKSNGGCARVVKDKQELYLHPQSLSGVVLEDNIPYIEQLLSNNDLFKFERIDIYDDVFDITDEEYLNILKSKRNEIELDILEVYKTKRKNLYITGDINQNNKVLDKYRIKRLSHYTGVYSSSNIDWQYIVDVFESLISEKRIVTAQTRSGIGYRTDKKLLGKITASSITA